MHAASAYEAKEQATRLLTAKLRDERLAREVMSGKPDRKVAKRKQKPLAAGGPAIRIWPLGDITLTHGNVRYWHKADMGWCTANVRFRG